MSVTTEINRLNTAKANLRTAIEGKGVTVPTATTIDGYAALVNSISSGGGTNPTAGTNDVVFCDYDGTVRYSYTAAEFAQLTALPPNPVHAGLTAQGWNWTLADAKACVSDIGMLDIGQNYITDDGKTRLYIDIEIEQQKEIDVYFEQTVANGISIDWGDGSEATTVSGTGAVTATHTYSEIGSYVIAFETVSGTLTLGHSGQTFNDHGEPMYTVLGELRTFNILLLTKAELGNVTSLASLCIEHTLSLKSISVSNNVQTIGTNAVGDCNSPYFVIPPTISLIDQQAFSSVFTQSGIGGVSVPNDVFIGYGGAAMVKRAYCFSVTQLPEDSFGNTQQLLRLVLPDTLVSIGSFAFYSSGLRSLTIPLLVSQIGSYAFNSMSLVKEYHFQPTTPPTLEDEYVFSGIPDDCVIYVPLASVNAYKTATNWTVVADKIVGE